MDRSRLACRRGPARWRSFPRAGETSASPAPAERRRTREVTGVREGGHHHDVAGLDPTVGYRTVEVDRDTCTEEVAAFVERIEGPRLGPLERFAPVAQEDPVRLVGDQQVDVFGMQADSITNG